MIDMEIRNVIKIRGKNYSIGTLKVLTGEETITPRKINKDFLVIAEAIDEPDNFSFLLKPLFDIPNDNDDLRLGLARIQIDSKLNMKEDLEAYNTRLFVAETIEKMLYGGLLIEGDGIKDEDEDDLKKTKKRSRRKKK